MKGTREWGEYRPFYQSWPDGADFQRLSSGGRFVLMMLKATLPAAGIAAVPGLVAVLSDRTALSESEVANALAELGRDGSEGTAGVWIRREGNVVWLVRGLEFEPTLSPAMANHRKHIRSAWAALPNLAIAQQFRAHYAEWFVDDAPPAEAPGEGDRPHPTGPGQAPGRPSAGPPPTPGQGSGSTTTTPPHPRRTAAPRASPPEVSPELRATVLRELPAEGQDALEGYLRTSARPEALLRELLAIASGLHPPQYPWPIIGRALCELALTPGELTAKRIRVFCQDLVDLGQVKPEHRGPNGARGKAPTESPYQREARKGRSP